MRQGLSMTDPRPARAVVFPADPGVPVTAETVDASEAGLWAFLGGQPEVLTLSDSAVMWLLAYGKTAPGAAANPRATRFADALLPGFARGDRIMGPVLVLGFDDEGLAAEVPAEVERAALGR
jgi:hypothetical protein